MRRGDISNRPYYSLNIPDLSAGLNLRDGLSQIKDNQLNEAHNMWYDGGFLKSRPAAISKGHSPFGIMFPGGKDTKTSATDIYVDDESVKGQLYQFEDRGVFTYKAVGSDGDVYFYGTEVDAKHCFATEHDGKVIAFCDENPEGTIAIQLNPFDAFTEKDCYLPTVIVQGKTGGSLTHSDDTGEVKFNYDDVYFKGINYEGYNLLNSNYKLKYSTVNLELFTDMIMSIPMLYKLPECPYTKSPKECAGKEIKAEIQYINKKVTHTAIVGSDGEAHEPEKASDYVRMHVKNGWISFEYEPEDWDSAELAIHPGVFPYASQSRSDFIEDNMEITLPGPDISEEIKKVTGMTQTAWFGGEASGLGGGTRLFLCGNVYSQYKDLVVWSDINNPLYFPENNYARIGNPSQRTTAFGKQGNKLVIFKEREMFYTQYVNTSDSLTTEGLMSQNIIDVTTATAIFPMVALNSSIGCDCPNTVRLCNNHLVWANKDGKIYTLITENQYNENSVYDISERIYTLLKKEDLSNAFAVDWNGKYLLSTENKVFVMDYSYYGFQRNESNMVWWEWEFPFKIEAMHESDGNVILFHNALMGIIKGTGEAYGSVLSVLDESKTEDVDYIFEMSDPENGDYDTIQTLEPDGTTTHSIHSWFLTKFFDFGSPTILKTIPKIELSLGTNGGAPINVRIVTEKSVDETVLILDEERKNERIPGYFIERLLRPGNKKARAIGLRFEGDGGISINSISLQYKILRGLR